MASTTRIERVLATLRKPEDTSKTASAVAPAAEPTPKTASAADPRQALNASLQTALGSTGETKVASAPVASPVASLEKMASDLAASESEARVKEAQVLANAFADTVISRLAQWQEKSAAMLASAPQIKVAAATPVSPFAKFANENSLMAKEAAQQGYAATKAALEKQSADQYSAGYEAGVAQVHKIASEEFAKAAVLTNRVLRAHYGTQS